MTPLSANPSLLAVLACPRDGSTLELDGGHLRCADGHTYPVVLGVPVLLVAEQPANHWSMANAFKIAGAPVPLAEVDPDVWRESEGINAFVQKWVVNSCGYLYRPVKGRLTRYPIPEVRLPLGEGRLLVDVGCSWGRWTVAAARRGYRCVGVDPNLNAVLAARRVCEALGVAADFVVGDARHLPFRSASVVTVYSYSVFQHFCRDDARQAMREVGRVLRHPGTCLFQMPNRFGVRSLYHQARRGFSEGKKFEVRYWSIPQLRREVAEAIGTPEFQVDGFFGLGIQAVDAGMLPRFERLVVELSERLRRWSARCPQLVWLADSLFLQVNRGPAPQSGCRDE